jgi:hypothetical protein
LCGIDRRVVELGEERQRLLRLYAKGTWSERDLDAQKSVMDEEEDALNEERLDLEHRKAQRIEKDQLVSRVRGVAHVITDLPDFLGHATDDEWKQVCEIMQLVVERVVIDGRTNLVIELALPETRIEDDAPSKRVTFPDIRDTIGGPSSCTGKASWESKKSATGAPASVPLTARPLLTGTDDRLPSMTMRPGDTAVPYRGQQSSASL